MKVTYLIAAVHHGIKHSSLLVHSLFLRVKKVKILRMRVAPRYTDLTTVCGLLWSQRSLKMHQCNRGRADALFFRRVFRTSCCHLHSTVVLDVLSSAECPPHFRKAHVLHQRLKPEITNAMLLHFVPVWQVTTTLRSWCFSLTHVFILYLTEHWEVFSETPVNVWKSNKTNKLPVLYTSGHKHEQIASTAFFCNFSSIWFAFLVFAIQSGNRIKYSTHSSHSWWPDVLNPVHAVVAV